MVSAEATSSHSRPIDLPSGNASESLKEFARQAMVDIVFDPSVMDAIVTNGVVGVLPPREALNTMLEGTGLVMNEDPDTGAFAVIRLNHSGGDHPNENTKPAGYTMNDEKNSAQGRDMKSKKGILSIFAAVVSAVTVGTGPVIAQEASEQQVFELSPFEVDASRDVGYIATSTLTGSRLRTNLSDVASSVSVYTEEFLSDTGMTNAKDLELYSVGTRNDSQDTSASGDDNSFQSGARVVQRVRLRGILGTKGLDYFQSYIPDDAYRASRYDESRGPNGILFGISDPGGIINTTTLRANTRVDSGRIRYAVDEYGRNRAEGYYNKVLADEVLGITIAGLHQENEGWRDFQYDDADRLYGAIMWQPTKKLSISINGETGELSELRYRKYSASDGAMAWLDHGRQTFDLTGNNPSSSEQAAGVVASYGSGERIIYVANEDEMGAPYFFQGGRTYYTASYEDRRVDGTFVQPDDGDIVERTAHIISSDAFPYPRDLNAVGPGSYRDTDFDTFTINLDYRITDNLYFNIAHNQQDVAVYNQFTSGNDPILRGDPNNTIRNPSQDPLNLNLANPYAGRLFFEGFWRQDEHTIDYKETRAALSWDFDMSDLEMDILGRHRLAAGYTIREVSDKLVGHYLGWLGAPFDAGDYDDSQNRLIVRNYITEGDYSTYYQPAPPPLGSVDLSNDDFGTQELGWVNQDRGTSNARSDVDVDSYIVALQSWFWEDRISTIFGYRQDKANNVAFGHVVDPLYGDTLTEDTEVSGYRVDDPITANTKTAGIVFRVTPNISLVANYATSIGLPEFRNVTLPNSGIPDLVDGEGYDIGIAFYLGKGEILSGRLVYYDVTQNNLTTSGGITRIVRDPMQQSMEALDDLYQGDPSAILKPDGSMYASDEWDTLVAELGPEVNAVYQDVTSNGWELTLTANLSRNWRLNFNASYTDRVLTNYGHTFLELAGYELDERGLAIQAVTLSDPTDQLSATVDYSKLREDGIHRRIMEIADGVVGEDATTFLTGEDSAGGGSFDVDDATVAYQMYDSISVLNYEKETREGRLGLNPWKFNVWTTYDFSEGALDGFSIGGGVRYLGPKVMATLSDGSELMSPSQTDLDLMLRYRQRLKNGSYIDYQVNVYNLLNTGGYTPERHVILARPETPLSRFEYRNPRTIRLTVTYAF